MPRYPRTSPSASSLSDRVFSRLAQRVREHEGKLYPLHIGDTWMEPLPAAQAEAQRSAERGRLHNYAPVQGEPVLLEAIEAQLIKRGGCLIDPDCIAVLSGATSALSVVSEALLDPGDEVLLPSPYWPLIRGILRKRGVTPVEVPFFTRLDEPELSVEQMLEASITDKTAAIYVNSPHNPTGAILDDTTLAAIGRVAAKHDLWILADEVYEEIYFGGLQPAPVWARADFQERCVAVHSMSKAYGLAGARVGWAHGPHEAMATIRSVATFSTYCTSKPMQIAASVALREGDAWLENARRSYEDAAFRVCEALDLEMPRGGTFVFVDVSRLLSPEIDTFGLLERCLDAGVLLTPGQACGADFTDWIRLCFTSVAPADLEEALGLIAPLLNPR